MESEAKYFDQRVSEADVDWIICVELNSCTDFRDWMALQIFRRVRRIVHVGAWRSIETLQGESDLLWLVETDGVQHLTLIENKVNAQSQPRQQARYRERAAQYVSEKLCSDSLVVLAAPEAYRSSDSDEYDVRISYESMHDWFAGRNSERGKYLARVFDAAIRSRRELAPPDAAVTEFRRKIWMLAEKEFPALGWRDPGPVSATMYWVEVSYSGFWLKYKMYKRAGIFGECFVDLELPGRANDVEALQRQHAAELKTLRATVATVGTSAAIRIAVPPIQPPIFQEDAVRAALRAAEALLAWWRSTPDLPS